MEIEQTISVGMKLEETFTSMLTFYKRAGEKMKTFLSCCSTWSVCGTFRWTWVCNLQTFLKSSPYLTLLLGLGRTKQCILWKSLQMVISVPQHISSKSNRKAILPLSAHLCSRLLDPWTKYQGDWLSYQLFILLIPILNLQLFPLMLIPYEKGCFNTRNKWHSLKYYIELYE